MPFGMPSQGFNCAYSLAALSVGAAFYAGPHTAGNQRQEMPAVQLFQDEARTPAAAAAGQEQQTTASPAAQAILSAISGGAKAPAQQQLQQQVRGGYQWRVGNQPSGLL